MRGARSVRRFTVLALLSGLLTPAFSVLSPATPASAATTCNPKSDVGWALAKDAGQIAYFAKASRGVKDAAPIDPAAFAVAVDIVAREVIASAGTTSHIKIIATGGADAAGRASSNKRIARARATFGGKAVKDALEKFGVKKVYVDHDYVVSTRPDNGFDRFFAVTVMKCNPAGSNPLGGRCQPPLHTLLHTESFAFQPAKSSRRDGLRPADRDVYTSRMVYVANIVKRNLTSPGGVYVEVTGYASPAGSASSNDWLAANRAKTAESSVKRALTRTLKSSSKNVTFFTSGAAERRTDPLVTVSVYYCP